MKLTLVVSLLSSAILLAALGYIFTHPVKKTTAQPAAHFSAGTETSFPLHLREMRKSERLQCAGTYVDRRKSMMRCTLPDDGSFIRGEQ